MTIYSWIDQSSPASEITLDKVMQFSGYRHNSTTASVLNEIYAAEMFGLVVVKRKANRKKFVLITKF